MTTSPRRQSPLGSVQLIAMFFIVFQFDFQRISGERLNEFVSHFEPLKYDRRKLEQTHRRVRRSLDKDSILHLDFKAYGRSFNLRLKRDTTIFAPNLEVDSEFDPAKVYKGHIDGHPNSMVHGFVHDGIFEGKIRLSDELHDEYHIEPSSDHFDTNRARDFHSVMYKASNVHYPYAYGKDLDLNERTKRWMEEARRLPDEHFSNPVKVKRSVPHRYKRQTKEKKICQIHLRADHLFTKNRADNNKERALLLMTKHVQAVHDIYRNTVFKINDEDEAGFGFAIKRMRANDSTDGAKSDNLYAQPFIGVEKFLDIISLETTSTEPSARYCLSHVFTYRDFEDGVLGLAWVGEPAGKAAGGICEIARQYSDGRKKTLNTGVVTFINYNKEVPSRVSEVTFAHELGHNFGSQHDSGNCGENSDGNFIMFPKATSGNDPNNRKFSDCSKRYIAPVIETKRDDCFQTTNASICGNQVVEDGEECDCGFEDDCTDKCCNPAGKGQACTRPSGVRCSPSEGLCCDKNTCEYANTTERCMHGDCIETTYCNGSSVKCPDPVKKPSETTDCNQNRSVCLDGECKGSRCLKFKTQECQCKETKYQCSLCCQDGEDKVCLPYNISGMSMLKPSDLLTGAPCNDYEGYCDILGKCRGVDSEGPLERIKNLLFGGDAISNLVDWVKTYWWAAILIGIGLILLMAAFIKVCSVATPSSNPNKPKAKTMSLRRHPRSNPGYSSNEPPPPYDIEMAAVRQGRSGRH